MVQLVILTRRPRGPNGFEERYRHLPWPGDVTEEQVNKWHADYVWGHDIEDMAVQVKRIHPDAKLPTYATAGAACFDLYACDIKRVTNRTITLGTGLTVEIPPGYCMKIYSRSGHGFNHDTRLANCVGVIDSDYRGEIMVKLTYDGIESAFHVNEGDRIAQAEIVPVIRVTFVEVDTLSDTERGTGGFGSTGK